MVLGCPRYHQAARTLSRLIMYPCIYQWSWQLGGRGEGKADFADANLEFRDVDAIAVGCAPSPLVFPYRASRGGIFVHRVGKASSEMLGGQ